MRRAVWYIKYTRLFWRPITAIDQGDGTNAPDASWTPFLTTPPHPECVFLSSHCCKTYPSVHSLGRPGTLPPGPRGNSPSAWALSPTTGRIRRQAETLTTCCACDAGTHLATRPRLARHWAS